MRLPHGCEGLRVRRMTVWWTFRRPCMGRPVPRQFMRNALLVWGLSQDSAFWQELRLTIW